ncbi:MFS transporter [Streptomyces heilongjiangensis]|uniref:MFS transporter n=1 Tax=Streptomyces heilongjiangensis TaxID=945052 RepID=A0ABW1B454_9ACTN|nr:MFS transporter [Streptomyces heilongjiangensis]MDC2946825.1 MFS transporter [Streptomyces heilongjiangensis]
MAAGAAAGRGLGREFRWLWTAYAVSVCGTRLAFDALPLIAVLVLDAGPAEVSALAATGLAVGAVVAVPLGPWMEFRRKRPVMIGTDLLRAGALLTVPAAYALDLLSFPQLLLVAVVVAAADITFGAASGAFLKSLLPPERLLAANGRFEATNWTATMLGPPLGGAAISLLGPVVTLVTDAVSYLLSATALRAIGDTERYAERPVQRPGGRPVKRPAHDGEAPSGGTPPDPAAPRLRARDLLDGWRYILTSPALRPLFLNTILVNGLIMATAPLLLVLMVGELGFAPWQYGLAFALPCVGGLIGSRLARRLVARHGQHRVLLATGALRACWPVGLAFVHPGAGGLALVMAVELGLITCMGVFNPVMATYRLGETPPDRVARTLSAWSVTSKLTIAVLTALWGLLAAVTDTRTAVAAAGALMLATPLLLPRHLPARPAPKDDTAELTS